MTIIPINPETGQVINNRRASTRVRENHPNAKMTQDQVDEIRKLAAQGITTMALVERFGLGKSSINDIIKNRTWKPLEGSNAKG